MEQAKAGAGGKSCGESSLVFGLIAKRRAGGMYNTDDLGQRAGNARRRSGGKIAPCPAAGPGSLRKP